MLFRSVNAFMDARLEGASYAIVNSERIDPDQTPQHVDAPKRSRVFRAAFERLAPSSASCAGDARARESVADLDRLERDGRRASRVVRKYDEVFSGCKPVAKTVETEAPPLCNDDVEDGAKVLVN